MRKLLIALVFLPCLALAADETPLENIVCTYEDSSQQECFKINAKDSGGAAAGTRLMHFQLDGTTQLELLLNGNLKLANDFVFGESTNDLTLAAADQTTDATTVTWPDFSGSSATPALLEQAQTFSATQTIQEVISGSNSVNDDAALSISVPNGAGLAKIVISNGDNDIGEFIVDVGATAAIVEVSDLNNGFATATGSCGGTTGTDGNLTVCADATNTQVDIENRSGGSLTVRHHLVN